MKTKILEVSDLVVGYADKKVLDGVTFSVDQHEIMGLVGPNGIGKSTLMKVISGVLKKEKGTILLDGISIDDDKKHFLEKQASMIEGPAFFPQMTGKENLKLISTLYHTSDLLLQEIMDWTELGSQLNKRVAKYSLGMKQRLGIGMLLLCQPTLLILDEPMNGLDPEGIMKLRTYLQEYAKNHRVCIMVSSHQLSEIEKLCDTVYFVSEKKLVKIQEKKDLEDRYREVYHV